MRYLILFIFFFYALPVFSQDNSAILLLKDELKKIQNNNDQALHLLKISERYLDEETFDSSLVYAEKVLEKDTSKEITISTNILLGKANIALGNYEQGTALLEKNITYLIERNDKRLSRVYLSLGNAYISLNMLDKALVSLKDSERLANEKDERLLYLYFLRLYANSHQYKKALDYLNKVTPLAKASGDKIQLAAAYSYYAKLNSTRGELQEAIKYYDLARELFKELNSEFNIAAIENNIAECYIKLGDISKSKKHFNSALSYSTKNNYPQITIAVISNWAKQNILNDLDIDQSIRELDSINNSNSFVNRKKTISENYYYLALGYLKKEDTLNTIISLKKAIDIANKEDFSLLNEKSLILLSAINYKQKNYREAYLNSKAVIEYKEDIYNDKKNKEIEFLRTQFDLNQKESDIKLKEQQLKLVEEKEIKNKSIYLFISLFLLFIIFSLFRQNKLVKARRKVLLAENETLILKGNQLNQKIESKDNYVTNLAIHIEEKNEQFKDIGNNIKKIKAKLKNQDEKLDLQRILVKVNNYINKNNDRIQIMLEVDKTNKDFYERLKLKYSNLTDQEIKVIGFLRLNMSSQQIANTINITEASVNNLRYKIRKKLYLRKGDNFLQFIREI